MVWQCPLKIKQKTTIWSRNSTSRYTGVQVRPTEPKQELGEVPVHPAAALFTITQRCQQPRPPSMAKEKPNAASTGDEYYSSAKGRKPWHTPRRGWGQRTSCWVKTSKTQEHRSSESLPMWGSQSHQVHVSSRVEGGCQRVGVSGKEIRRSRLGNENVLETGRSVAAQQRGGAKRLSTVPTR